MKKVIILLSISFLTILIGTKIVTHNIGSQREIEPEVVQGIILPHHALAEELLTDSFDRLKKTINPKTIVVYGTNHYFPVSETFTTTTQTKDEFGLENALADDQRIEKDHSISTVVPYIQNYFPKAKIVPILISGRYQDLELLKNNVDSFTSKFGKKDTLYIASVDFAHDVNLNQGLSNNSESIESIKNFNYSELLSYNDLHMDSPTAISVLLISMQRLEATTWSTWHSSHGALLTSTPNLEGTSYVIGTFTNTKL